MVTLISHIDKNNRSKFNFRYSKHINQSSEGNFKNELVHENIAGDVSVANSCRQKKVFTTNLMSEVVSSELLEEVFLDIYEKRKDNSHNSDIWKLSLNWKLHKEEIREQLLVGTYLLSPVDVYKGPDGEYYSRWSSRDSIVLKALSKMIAKILEQNEIGKDCYHLKGMGGIKGALRKVRDEIAEYRYVVKSDVANFYASTNHEILLEHCAKIIKDKRVLNILHQYMNRLEDVCGEYKLITEGISKGCSLSPLMGALILKSLDAAVNKFGFAYTRYMDDWVILVKTRGELRKIVKKMHEVMHKLKFKLAVDKTYIGKISNGIDFLGYRLSNEGIIGLARKTKENFINKTLKLYEQGADIRRIGCYIKRWSSWCVAGL